MIYTVGDRAIYDAEIADTKSKPFLKPGEPVWRTRRDAERYLFDLGLSAYAVYGVVGNWDHDTRGPMRGCRWRELGRACAVVALPAKPKE